MPQLQRPPRNVCAHVARFFAALVCIAAASGDVVEIGDGATDLGIVVIFLIFMCGLLVGLACACCCGRLVPKRGESPPSPPSPAPSSDASSKGEPSHTLELFHTPFESSKLHTRKDCAGLSKQTLVDDVDKQNLLVNNFIFVDKFGALPQRRDNLQQL